MLREPPGFIHTHDEQYAAAGRAPTYNYRPLALRCVAKCAFVLNFQCIVQSRSITMFRGIATALFAMGIFSQHDRAFFPWPPYDAALKLAWEIGRGFGL
jgi:hypothetical protein